MMSNNHRSMYLRAQQVADSPLEVGAKCMTLSSGPTGIKPQSLPLSLLFKKSDKIDVIFFFLSKKFLLLI